MVATCSVGTNRNSAFGSMNFRMSQGQATRSTLTPERVIHFIRLSLGEAGGHAGADAIKRDGHRLDEHSVPREQVAGSASTVISARDLVCRPTCSARGSRSLTRVFVAPPVEPRAQGHTSPV